MKQVTRSLLALGGLAIVGGGALWFATRDGKSGGGDEPGRLVQMEPQELRAVDVSVQGTKYTVELTKQGWQVDGEPPIGADPTKVDELLGAFVRARVVDWLSPDETPSDEEMGLEGAGTVVAVFHPHSGREMTLSVGKSSAFDKNVFARFAQGDDAARVVLLPPGTRAQLARPPSTYYDRRPLGVAPEHIRSLRVVPTEPSDERVAYTLERGEDGVRWRVKDPDVGDADPFVVRQLIEGLTGTRISVFPELHAQDQLASFGLEPPRFKVEAVAKLAAEDAAPVVTRTLRVGPVINPEEELLTDQTVRIAREDQPWVGEVSAILLHALPRRMSELKSKQLAWVAADDVKRIEMELHSAGSITLERASTDPPTWRMLAPEPAEASPQKVSAILLALSTLSGVSREAEGEAADDPALLAKLGLGESADHVRLLGDGDQVLLDLQLGKADAGSRFASAGGGFIARVPEQKLHDLPENAAELFKTKGLYKP